MDSKTGWPDANFLRAPTTNKVLEFLDWHIADNGIPRKIGTDPGMVFVRKQIANINFIQHINCPIQDHRGTGYVERPIRTVNERLRAKNILY